ncbi:MAG: hypothetical protein MUE96_10465 [Bacteroidia bacterium]|jgi:YVTN family beta-propeller protein|nr:hypothetical protein [Bacteroidia bacterium]
MKQQILTYLLIGQLCWLFSCDDKPNIVAPVVIPPPVKGAVWIANEGNFQMGNASLTVLDLEKKELYENVFENNNGRKLGDVFQSINFIQNLAYLVVNNSQKIEVCDPKTFQSVAIVSGFTSPRYIVQHNSTSAFVSEYYANAIRRVNLSTQTIDGTIAVPSWIDEMVIQNNRLYAAGANSKSVYIIDLTTQELTDSIIVGNAPTSIVIDFENNLWILCKGKPELGTKPTLHRYHSINKTIDKTITLNIDAEATRLRINALKNKLYWLARDVYTLNILDSNATPQKLVDGIGKTFYGLGVNPKTEEIYVSNAKDYVQRSTVIRYDAVGNYLGDFNAGLITSDFYFYYP